MFWMETKKLRLPIFRNSLQMLVISGKYKKRCTKKERKKVIATKKAQSSILYCRKKFLVASKEEQEVIIVFIQVEQEIDIKTNDCHVLIFNRYFQ